MNKIKKVINKKTYLEIDHFAEQWATLVLAQIKHKKGKTKKV